MGLQETMVAVKSYGHYISVLTHIAEEALTKTIADHGLLEGDLKKADDELKDCKAERDRLLEDVQKYEREKTHLEGNVESLTKENERLSAELEQAAKDLGNARADVERCHDMLKGVSTHFPNLPPGSSLAGVVDDLKGSVALSFEQGFELALEQFKVLYPDADASQFDYYKVVKKDGRIVEEEEEPGAASLEEAPAEATRPAVDLASVNAFLLNNKVFGGRGWKSRRSCCSWLRVGF